MRSVSFTSVARAGLILLAFGACLQPGRVRAGVVDGGRYGPVQLEVPAGTTRGYVVLFSDLTGWQPSDQAALEAISQAGAIAVGVDTRTYLDNIASGKRTCDQLVGDAEGLSRQLQREYGHEAYWFPILAGIGAGGTLARVTLSEAPKNTLSGAVSLNPSAVLPGPRPLCPGAASIPAGANLYRYGPSPVLSGFWSAGVTPAASTRTRLALLNLRQHGTPVQVQLMAGVPAKTLVELLQPHLAGNPESGVDSLPLIELPVAGPEPAMVVVLSGDGGWRDLDKTIAEQLQRDGVPVVGWDCVRYFWRKKTPQEAGKDLASVLSWYIKRWQVQKVALVGYSFGADVLPFMYAELPPELKSRVVLMSLLALSNAADWEIKVTGWLGQPASDDATPTAPALAKLPHGLVQCFYGSEETESACPSLAASGADLVETSGGHHFNGDYVAIERRILTQLRARSAPPAAALNQSGTRGGHS